GLGVAGGGADDYRWIERWQGRGGNWQTRFFQLQRGFTTVAQDAAATPGGFTVLGIGTTSSGQTLVLRESPNGGMDERNVLLLDGITDLGAARLAIGEDVAAVVASVEGKATVVGCTLR